MKPAVAAMLVMPSVVPARGEPASRQAWQRSSGRGGSSRDEALSRAPIFPHPGPLVEPGCGMVFVKIGGLMEFTF